MGEEKIKGSSWIETRKLFGRKRRKEDLDPPLTEEQHRAQKEENERIAVRAQTPGVD